MIDYPNIDPVAIELGPLAVHWYGIMYLIGFAGAYLLGNYRAKHSAMSFHGGLIGVILAMLLFARKYNKHFVDVMDFLAPLVPIGLGTGRLGNFIGGELWGRQTDVPWAMVFPTDPLQLARHPSQLYQFALEGVALFAIVWFISRSPKPRYFVSASFLACYGLFRILVEFVREPDSHIGYIAFGWLTQGQLLSVPMLLIGLALIVYSLQTQQISKPLATKK